MVVALKCKIWIFGSVVWIFLSLFFPPPIIFESTKSSKFGCIFNIFLLKSFLFKKKEPSIWQNFCAFLTLIFRFIFRHGQSLRAPQHVSSWYYLNKAIKLKLGCDNVVCYRNSHSLLAKVCLQKSACKKFIKTELQYQIKWCRGNANKAIYSCFCFTSTRKTITL